MRARLTGYFYFKQYARAVLLLILVHQKNVRYEDFNIDIFRYTISILKHQGTWSDRDLFTDSSKNRVRVYSCRDAN